MRPLLLTELNDGYVLVNPRHIVCCVPYKTQPHVKPPTGCKVYLEGGTHLDVRESVLAVEELWTAHRRSHESQRREHPSQNA